MLRRFIIAGFAAALAAPVFTIAPASAAVLFTCSTIDPGSNLAFTNGTAGGLTHTKAPQVAWGSGQVNFPACSNGENLGWEFGEPFGYTKISTPAATPLGCPQAWGGAAGNDYPDKTKILLGLTDPAFGVNWNLGGSSTGVVKFKAGPAGTQWRFVFVIKAGKYVAPAGHKTKMKATVNIAPAPGSSYTCADDSNPLETIVFQSLVGNLTVVQV